VPPRRGWRTLRTVGGVLKQKAAALISAVLLGLAVLTGCSSDNVDCGLDSCSVTIEREVNATASVLGVEAKFISADADTVTLEVAGEQIQLTKGQQAVQVGGLQVSLDSINAGDVKFLVQRQ
jgi:hypothetical protein